MTRSPCSHPSPWFHRLGSPTLVAIMIMMMSACQEERVAEPAPHDLAQTAWVPLRAREAITAAAAGGEITRIEAVDDGQGGFRYQATIKSASGAHDRSARLVTVAADGAMIGEQQAPAQRNAPAPGPSPHLVDLAMLPELARVAILKQVLAADIKRIEQLGDGADAIYEVVAEHAGVVTRLQVDAAGRIRGGSAATYSLEQDGTLPGPSSRRPPADTVSEAAGAAPSEPAQASRADHPEPDRSTSDGFEVDADGHLVSICRFYGGMALGDVKIGMATFQCFARSGIIRRVEQMICSGRESYVGLVEERGRLLSIESDRDGHAVSTRMVTRTLALAEMDGPVAASIVVHAGHASIQSIEEQTEDGRIVYVVRLENDEAPAIGIHGGRRLVQR